MPKISFSILIYLNKDRVRNGFNVYFCLSAFIRCQKDWSSSCIPVDASNWSCTWWQGLCRCYTTFIINSHSWQRCNFNYKYVTYLGWLWPFKGRYCLCSRFVLCLAQKSLGLWPELFNAAETHKQRDESRLKNVMCVFSTKMVLQVLHC